MLGQLPAQLKQMVHTDAKAWAGIDGLSNFFSHEMCENIQEDAIGDLDRWFTGLKSSAISG